MKTLSRCAAGVVIATALATAPAAHAQPLRSSEVLNQIAVFPWLGLMTSHYFIACPLGLVPNAEIGACSF